MKRVYYFDQIIYIINQLVTTKYSVTKFRILSKFSHGNCRLYAVLTAVGREVGRAVGREVQYT